MAQDVLHFAQEKAATKHLRSSGVPKIVEANVLDVRDLPDRVPEAPNIHMLCARQRAREYEATPVPLITKRLQGLHGRLIELDPSIGTILLGSKEQQSSSSRGTKLQKSSVICQEASDAPASGLKPGSLGIYDLARRC